MTNFHEGYAEEHAKPPSDRSTGLVFAAVLVVVAVANRERAVVMWPAVLVAAFLAGASIWFPSRLRPLTAVWFRFSMLLHRVVNPAVMFLVFVAVFVPAGLIMRIWSDPLRSHRKSEGSYWIDCRSESVKSSSMKQQF
jgi:hypothetical protein